MGLPVRLAATDQLCEDCRGVSDCLKVRTPPSVKALAIDAWFYAWRP